MECIIREARAEDAPSMVALLNPIIEAGVYTIMDEPFTVREQLEYLQRFPERGVFNVALGPAGKSLLGMQSIEPVSAERAQSHVGDVSTFVSLGARHRGVGRRLCAATFPMAREQGYRKLLAMIRADNREALAFYASQGFTVIGTARRHARVRGRFLDEVLTERWIDAD